MAVLSTLRHADSPMSFNCLNDDCLILLFSILSVPQLFHLRGVSRRLCHLIEKHSLPTYRSLIYGYDRPEESENQLDRKQSGTVQTVFSRRTHQLCRRTGFHQNDHSRILHINEREPVKLHLLPGYLPNFFPRLSCLTFTYFLSDSEQELNAEQLAVNRLAVAYLDSHWSKTLLSLHLYIQVPSKPLPENGFFAQINKLASLGHLYLEFTQFQTGSFRLPDSMIILRQLLSFSLNSYGGPNTAQLLHQLGPELSSLSLYNVICSVEEYAAFLRAKPTYEQTLKELVLNLNNTHDWRLFTVTAQCLSSLEGFFFKASIEPEGDLIAIFAELNRLSHLRSISNLIMNIGQLRTLHQQISRPGRPRTLPRLERIRVTNLTIYNSVSNQETFTEGELLDELLPLVAHVFCALESLRLSVVKFPITSLTLSKGPLAKKLSAKVKQLFTGLHESFQFVTQ